MVEPNVRSNALLHDLQKKQISMQEFLEETAMWTVEIIDSYQWKTIPMKSDAVIEHENIPEYIRKGFDKQYWAEHPQVEAYYSAMSMINHENQSIYDWLTECMKNLQSRKEGLLVISRKMAEAPPGVKR